MLHYSLVFCYILSLGGLALGQPMQANPVLAAQRSGFDSLYQARYGARIMHLPHTRYTNKAPLVKGHPFLAERNWQKGVVYTLQDSFPGVYLNLDVYKSALLFTTDTNSVLRLTLAPDQVHQFRMGKRTFVKFDPGKISATKSAEKYTDGYLERLHQGRLGLYRAFEKRIAKTSGGDNGRFVLRQHLLIRQGTEFTLLKSKGLFLNLCGDL